MKNVKINLDRPPVDSKSIQAHKDFNGLLKNHAVMTKPFYKSSWFIGTTGLASVSIIVGGVIAFSGEEQLADQSVLNTEAPPEVEVTSSQPQLIAFNDVSENLENLAQVENDQSTKQIISINNSTTEDIDDKTNTLENQKIQDQIESTDETVEEIDVEKIEAHEVKHEEAKTATNYTDVWPRISGKLNGYISKEELMDNKGLTTQSDINIIHFELHVIDGLGGEVHYKEESNQLNEEMKEAIEKIGAGETIFFEEIDGQTKEGDVVRLNPLRYVLLN
ncbi:hypothetical protein K6119_05390 [Paracrocinitomix mangrovi]|uniref:hypothetical protein n=1 Tax=Paracrocinitomix mangrovi TaxID=2862509 RepID=UPI001C8DEB57|nr:hypothetical protein [Paracrocinitomix mangrovi]UKN02947.1 hypothetical protein K6119_05390 [Paracrocinitomix mangrovi]